MLDAFMIDNYNRLKGFVTSQMQKRDPQVTWDTMDHEGKTLLEYAILQGNANEVQALVKQGAKPTREHLVLALQKDNNEVSEIVLNHFMDTLNWWKGYCTNPHPFKPIDYSKGGPDEEYRHMEVISWLLGALPTFSAKSVTLLKKSKIIDDTDAMIKVITHYMQVQEIDPEQIQNPDEAALALALHFGCLFSDPSLIAKSISQDPRVVNKVCKMRYLHSDNDSPLQISILKQDAPTSIKLLDSHCDINYQNLSFENALFTAIKSQNASMVKLLLKKRIALDTNANGETPLHAAVKVGNEEVLNILLSDPRVKLLLNDKDYFDLSPLDYARHHNNEEMFLRCAKQNGLVVPITPMREMVNLHQIRIESKMLFRALLKNQSIENYPKWNACNGLSFLKSLYFELGVSDDFWTIMNLMAKWDGTEEALDKGPDIKLKSGTYKNLNDLFEQISNDLIVLTAQAPAFGPFGTVLKTQQTDRKEQLELLTHKKVIIDPLYSESNLYGANLTLVPMQDSLNAEQFQEHLDIISCLPGTKFELRGRGHATGGVCLPNHVIDYYDSSRDFRTYPTDNIKLLNARIQKFLFSHDAGKLQLYLLVYKQTEGQPCLFDFKKYNDKELFNGFYDNSPNHFSPLHVAILLRNYSAIEKYLDNPELDPNLPDAFRRPPLSLALISEDKKILSLLLSRPDIKISEEQRSKISDFEQRNGKLTLLAETTSKREKGLLYQSKTGESKQVQTETGANDLLAKKDKQKKTLT